MKPSTRRHLSWLTQAALIGGLLLINGCQHTEDDALPFERVQDGEDMPGGETTNVLLLGSNAFIKPASNLSDEHESLFFSGNSFFNQNWVEAPASTQSRDGLGPTFNARSCSGCHFKDGRGRPALTPDEAQQGLLVRLSIPGADEHGEPLPDPNYGGQLQDLALPNVPFEGKVKITYTEIEGTYGDGEPYTLLEPTYTIDELAHGPMSDEIMMSARVAPAMIGLGLLEAIPESRLKELADPDDSDNDGIAGQINMVWDIDAAEHRPGRFGWKSEMPTVEQQTAGAFLGDVGITSRLFPTENCTDAQAECQASSSGGEPELADHLLDRVTVYSSALAVPVRASFKNPQVLRGKGLFHQAGCAKCHTPSHTTGPHPFLPEFEGQLIWPYTDLLLHDMGPGLADGRPVFDADGQQWRTPPLWGLGFIETVNGHDRFLHDGRARGFAEAILWHGGEAEASKEAFRNMNKEDREAVLRFLGSL